jgi:hypothetical protein
MRVSKLLLRQIWRSSLFLGLKLVEAFFHYGKSVKGLRREKKSEIFVFLFHPLKRRHFEIQLDELLEEKLVEERLFLLTHNYLCCESQPEFF